MGSERGVPCANLRLYSGYGPLEDSSRLVPQLVIRALESSLPNFVDRTVSRDFIFVDDIVEAFLDTANCLTPNHYGQSFNIGTGQKTTIGEISELARQIFDIKEIELFDITRYRDFRYRDFDDGRNRDFRYRGFDDGRRRDFRYRGFDDG